MSVRQGSGNEPTAALAGGETAMSWLKVFIVAGLLYNTGLLYNNSTWAQQAQREQGYQPPQPPQPGSWRPEEHWACTPGGTTCVRGFIYRCEIDASRQALWVAKNDRC